MILVKTEKKDTIKVCWQCGVHDISLIGRYEKTRVNVLTIIMTYLADSDVDNDGGHIESRGTKTFSFAPMNSIPYMSIRDLGYDIHVLTKMVAV